MGESKGAKERSAMGKLQDLRNAWDKQTQASAIWPNLGTADEAHVRSFHVTIFVIVVGLLLVRFLITDLDPIPNSGVDKALLFFVIIWVGGVLLTLKPIETQWNEVAREIVHRKELVFSAYSALFEETNGAGITKEQALHMAATDVFIEKAQRLLTRRARRFMFAGSALLLGALALSLYCAHTLHTDTGDILNDIAKVQNLTGSALTILLFKMATTGALVAIALYILLSVARAMFHEGVCCYKQRHSLRFGRMVVYMNNGDIDIKDLEEAFSWNKEFSTAFKDIQAEKMVSLPVSKLTDLASEMVKAASGK